MLHNGPRFVRYRTILAQFDKGELSSADRLRRFSPSVPTAIGSVQTNPVVMLKLSPNNLRTNVWQGVCSPSDSRHNRRCCETGGQTKGD
jgi:hypothetical protein